MSTNSGIQWTTHTFNPWWGCEKVAQGCRNCYAEGVATRFYGRNVWGPAAKTERKPASEKVWNDPMRWNRAAERAGNRARVFCLSMGDVCEDHPQLVEPRKRLVGIIESTPWLDWQLLTKRPENAAMLWPLDKPWPSNVWFGTSMAIQSEADRNIPLLEKVPAVIRFLSVEPQVGPIDFFYGLQDWGGLTNVHWVIVGGESGNGARPFNVAWAESIRDQCASAGVAYFLKQLGSNPRGFGQFHHPNNEGYGIAIGGDSGNRMADKKGGDMAEWPEGLRVRQMPEQVPSP